MGSARCQVGDWRDWPRARRARVRLTEGVQAQQFGDSCDCACRKLVDERERCLGANDESVAAVSHAATQSESEYVRLRSCTGVDDIPRPFAQPSTVYRGRESERESRSRTAPPETTDRDLPPAITGMASYGTSRALAGAIHLTRLSNRVRKSRTVSNESPSTVRPRDPEPPLDRPRTPRTPQDPVRSTHSELHHLDAVTPAKSDRLREQRPPRDDAVIEPIPRPAPPSPRTAPIEPRARPLEATPAPLQPTSPPSLDPVTPPPSADPPRPSLAPTAPLPSPPAAPVEPIAPAPTPETVPIPDIPEPELAPSPLTTAPSSNATISKVPSSKFGRLLHYGGEAASLRWAAALGASTVGTSQTDASFAFSPGRLTGLAASLGWGMASEAVFRPGGSASSGAADGTDAVPKRRSLLMSEANLERLVSKLGKMRGAALKLGQFMSIQGASRASLYEWNGFRRRAVQRKTRSSNG